MKMMKRPFDTFQIQRLCLAVIDSIEFDDVQDQWYCPHCNGFADANSTQEVEHEENCVVNLANQFLEVMK